MAHCCNFAGRGSLPPPYRAAGRPTPQWRGGRGRHAPAKSLAQIKIIFNIQKKKAPVTHCSRGRRLSPRSSLTMHDDSTDLYMLRLRTAPAACLHVDTDEAIEN